MSQSLWAVPRGMIEFKWKEWENVVEQQELCAGHNGQWPDAENCGKKIWIRG